MNELYNVDCISWLAERERERVDLTLTDIPYGVVNRKHGTLRKAGNLDKGTADEPTFELQDFLERVYDITTGTIIIFCAKEQLSEIYNYFNEKQKQKQGTVRQIIWEKTNPSPMNGQYVYLSGIENAVWFRKKGGTFNARCKNPVFKYPKGNSKVHPTEKNHKLLKELILDNSNVGDIVFDPCAGSASTLLCAKQLGRNYIGCEIDRHWYEIGKQRLKEIEDV